MKKLPCVFTVILLAILLAGCSNPFHFGSRTVGNELVDTPLKDVVTLRYMIWDINQVPAYEKIIANFHESHPNISVDIQVVPWNNYWEKLMTEIAGGSAPDIFWGFIPQVPSLADKNALLPITDYIESDQFNLDSLNAELVKGFEYNGEQYGIPKDWDTLGVFYNKELLNRAGFDHYPDNLSWNPTDGGSLVEFLQKLTIDAGGKHPGEEGFDPDNIVQYGFNYTDRGVWDPGDLIGFVASNDAEILSGGQFKPEDKMFETLQFLHDLVFKYHVSPVYTDVKVAGSDKMFLSEQTALWVTGSWQIIPIQQKAGFEWGIAQFPAGPNNKRVVRVNGLADHISAQTRYKEEAWAFMKFINSPGSQDILGQTGTVLPMNQDSIGKFVDYYKKQGIDTSVFVEAFNGDTVTMPVTKNYMEWVQIWYKTMGLIFSGQMDLEEGLEKIRTEGNPITTE
ncbi:ABC transporter substrate-binding protein [Paenibacillus abyssi]|uniref:Sugar ABC transporter substrate-binding protein n=1 Tax=Paenibacillus abyssi TaxID=1340531 RepID=A0A917G286_9BACL|nr:sugar ABC transporter substrate-binding protein [Paenibacillus abyssi]GGG19213.1 sugar ABC transporter substrate-binding protein [Paenibacillus abyssi]